MKKRLISIAVGFVLLAAVMFWVDGWVVNVTFALLGGLAIYEALRALKMHDNILCLAIFIGLHVLNMLLDIEALYIVYLLLFAMFCLVMRRGVRKYTYKEGAAALTATLMITLGLRSILRIRDLLGHIDATRHLWDIRFVLFICLGLGWICDTLAFAFGHWLGKKKLCPEISPNKTVAGAIGGLVGTPIIVTAAFYIYSVYGAPPSVFYAMNELPQLAFYAVLGLLGAAIGIIGDLAASFIKRECGIKDFGRIMPGHGGAFDRLDSVLFTSVFATFALELFLRLFAAVPA